MTTMLADALEMPWRDIYLARADVFHFKRTPLTPSCVVKSHELPGSPMLEVDPQHVHVVRDGRDVVVSRFFYDSEFSPANGFSAELKETFDEYVPRVAREWRDFVLAWADIAVPVIHYEDMVRDPARELRRFVSDVGLNVSPRAIAFAVANGTPARMRKRLAPFFKHNSFVRMGVAGEWRKHFEPRHRIAFDRCAGDALSRFDYQMGDSRRRSTRST
jgi:hypothetical protein